MLSVVVVEAVEHDKEQNSMNSLLQEVQYVVANIQVLGNRVKYLLNKHQVFLRQGHGGSLHLN